MPTSPTSTISDAHVPTPPSERWQRLVALTLGALGAGLCAAVFTGVVGRTTETEAAPPAVLEVAKTPVPGPTASASVLAGVAGGERMSGGSRARATNKVQRERRDSRTRRATPLTRAAIARQTLSASWLVDKTESDISMRWMEGFYPIYAIAQRTFGVSWLLIASIHRQESAFSTDPSTYRGLNFAGCCGGPMQFNVTNGDGRGTGSTWDLFSGSYRYGSRPAVYNHMTATHPSIYDDFDSIMAAARRRHKCFSLEAQLTQLCARSALMVHTTPMARNPAPRRAPLSTARMTPVITNATPGTTALGIETMADASAPDQDDLSSSGAVCVLPHSAAEQTPTRLFTVRPEPSAPDWRLVPIARKGTQ